MAFMMSMQLCSSEGENVAESIFRIEKSMFSQKHVRVEGCSKGPFKKALGGSSGRGSSGGGPRKGTTVFPAVPFLRKRTN